MNEGMISQKDLLEEAGEAGNTIEPGIKFRGATWCSSLFS